MARHAPRVALAVALLAPTCLSAQTLARLHVRAFDLSSDATNVTVGQAFHVTLHVKMDERVASLDNVQLPALSGFEDLGDERRCSIAAQGADCVETLTIDATAPGDRDIGPAAIEFVDGATGRPRVMQSNVITIHITGAAQTSPAPSGADDDGDNPIADLIWGLVRAVVIFVLVVIAAWALIWGYRRRPRAGTLPAPPATAPLPTQPAPPPAAVETPWAQRMRELGESLASQPTRARALAVRGELRAHIGAGERETIADLTRRNAAAGDACVMPALVAVERAAFCPDDHVADAAREAVPYLMQ